MTKIRKGPAGDCSAKPSQEIYGTLARNRAKQFYSSNKTKSTHTRYGIMIDKLPQLLPMTSEQAYRKTLELFAPKDNSVFEIRTVGSTPLSGYFMDKENALQWLLNDPEQCWYIVMNEIKPDVFAREQHEQILASRFSKWTKRYNTVKNRLCTTSDPEITRLRWILIDYDAERPSGISSSDAEKELAFTRCMEGLNYIHNELKLPHPIICDSGNGYHQIFAIDRPPEDKDTVTNFLNHVADKLSDNVVKIDTTVGNPSRITKLYGTMTDKGADFRNIPNIDDRPHRQSGYIFIPEELEVLK